MLLSPGLAGHNPFLLPVLDAICVHGPAERPRKRPDLILADKAYAHESTRAALRRRGIRHAIPSAATSRNAGRPRDAAADGP